jgi:hypothetical protein
VIDYPGDTPGRGGWHRNEQGLALVRHPAGVRKLAYGGASSIWPFDPYNGPAIYGDRGTHLHSICDLADAGEPLPPAFIAAGVALDISADLQAYIYARYIVFLKAHGLTVTHVEVPVVVDRAKVATNIDRVVKRGNCHYVADIKSSSRVESPGYLLQLALAAESTPYDQATDERQAWDEPISSLTAFIFWFPLSEAIKNQRPEWPDWTLVEVDLAPGADLLDLLLTVRDDVTHKDCFTKIAAPADGESGDEVAAPSLPLEVEQPATGDVARQMPSPVATLDEARARYRELSEGDKAAVARYWEANDTDLTDADQIIESIGAIIGFRDIEVTPPPPVVVSNPTPALPTVTDEGDTLDDDAIEAAKKRYGALDDAARAWVAHSAAKVRLSPEHGGKATQRRMEIYRGLCELAESDGFDTDDVVKGITWHILGDIVWQGPKVPDILGALSLTEASRFARMCDIVTTGDVAVHWTDDRRMVFSASLVEVAA